MRNSNMETWFIFVMLFLCVSIIIKRILYLVFPRYPLPPGPPKVPIIGNFKLLQRFNKDPKTVLEKLHAKYGPIFSFQMGSHTDIFIANRFLAHQALIQNGSTFADRPVAVPTKKIISSNQNDILFSFYGPVWRALRRNLTSNILHPSQVKSYANARKWVLDMLLDRLKPESGASNPIRVIDHFQYSMFCLLSFMCFGDKLDEKQIREIEDSLRTMLLSFTKYNVLNFWPTITRILFWKRWKEFLQLRRDLEALLIPYIDARKKAKQERLSKDGKEDNINEFVLCYVDTLLNLRLVEEDEGSKLDYGNICTLCSEFLNAGTDTTSTALEWIMANLVKYPQIQERLVEEIREVMVEGENEVKEEHLPKLPYLKSVILEGLRRHPPLHYVAPHRVTKDVVLDGYLVPTTASVNFFVAEIGRDPTAWDDPMAFKPERFMDNGGTTFDIMGSKEINMMPFGAGRRMCPGYGLAILHLEYFVANLVWNFEWKAMSGDDIDMSEKLLFTTVMKNPLKVHILPRK
ncbi:cytochrome P450 89A2-like [Arachis ipaensis]|uniref:Cytochrome P450 n=1 Tax=Arachis hypogaea TaxID=3818 RepID=A0A445A732_ARAHY|nr:cytochrome P450 89A2-like [Arachis ipaensis]XP_025642886.1 cytochrome P450 89A2 [Arachis hypogaea]QHN99692.1 Cytochrome P450 [Arachis hypogaea]RYR22264.1 hypothetical protein Ahy_B03g067548 [Arachis hypogaea]